jgi:TolB-like protein
MITSFSPRRLVWLSLVGLALAPVLLSAGCATAPINGDRRVLVMNFESTVSDKNAGAYSRALAEMMTACLVNYPRVAVIERQDLRALEGSDSRPMRWQSLGRQAGVDYVIVGSVSRLEKNFILTARLLSVRTGEIVKGSSVTRYCQREEDLYPVIQAMSRAMAAHLKYLAELYDAQARAEGTTPAATPPANP